MRRLVPGIAAFALLASGAFGVANSEVPANRYPAMAPVAEYLIADRNDEIALARSAAPPSISANATILVLRAHGYETATTGTNGWVCFVERSWTAGFEDPEFWNPKLRGPNCFNSIAAETELPRITTRTEWVLAGVSKADMMQRSEAAIADGTFKDPLPGALTYMLSKQGYLSDDGAGPWLPHLMLFVPRKQVASWGAGMKGSPVIDGSATDLDTALVMIPVRRWSDGSPAPAAAPLPSQSP